MNPPCFNTTKKPASIAGFDDGGPGGKWLEPFGGGIGGLGQNFNSVLVDFTPPWIKRES